VVLQAEYIVHGGPLLAFMLHSSSVGQDREKKNSRKPSIFRIMETATQISRKNCLLCGIIGFREFIFSRITQKQGV
jgi:hypothetical protein